MDQSDGKAKVWRLKGSTHDPKHTSSSETQVYIIVHISSIINSEVYRNITLHQHLIGRSFIMQQDNDPKHSANTTEFIRGKTWKVLHWPSQSPHLNPVEYVFYLLKKRLKGLNPQN